MPQPKRSSAGSGSKATRTSAKSQSSSPARKKKPASAASGAGAGKRSSSSRSRTQSRSGGRAASGASGPAATAKSVTDQGLEAAAARLRELNERIIVAGKSAGETTLRSYQSVLESIAQTLERGAERSDVDWISELATSQAKFIRDVATAWTSAARGLLK